jgi:hypothetical protein
VSLKLYLISCDLLFPGGDYASLKEKLRTLGASQTLESQWALRSNYTAAELKDIVGGFLDRHDGVTVTEVGEERASRRAKSDLTRL